MRIQGIQEIQEKQLFHGTDIKNVDYICKYNFDVRLAGQHGSTYGKGKFIVLIKVQIWISNSSPFLLSFFFSADLSFFFYVGIYFARYAAYADGYSKSSSKPLPVYGGETQRVHSGKTKIIFLARVMTGKPVVGRSHFQKPDHGSPENLHDSCVDDVSHPNIFVIFDPNQIYPEYVIQYSWAQHVQDQHGYLKRYISSITPDGFDEVFTAFWQHF